VRTIPDMDGDGIFDLEEATFEIDALDSDTDGDGFTDGCSPSAGSLIALERVRERTSTARPGCAGQLRRPASPAASTKNSSLSRSFGE